MRKLFGIAVATALAVAAAGLARADEPPLKIGVVMTYSGRSRLTAIRPISASRPG